MTPNKICISQAAMCKVVGKLLAELKLGSVLGVKRISTTSDAGYDFNTPEQFVIDLEETKDANTQA